MKPAVFKHRRTAADAWLERTNPLQGLSIAQAQAVFDLARAGNYARLQYMYAEIERADPVLMTCVERRASALSGMGWEVSAKAAAPDPALADDERDALTLFLSGLPNLEEAIEHLGLAFFRGFSHVGVADALEGGALSLLDSWNFCRDPLSGAWWWNPACEMGAPGTGSQTEAPSAELCSVVRPRAIDYPALSIFLRHAVAERDWGRFLERYGLPPVILTAPENTPDEQMAAFADSARDVADGLSSAMPAGTGVNFAGEARGSDPFSAFIEHQQKLVVLLATGGTLTSLAEAGSGTLAGNAQMDVWREIVGRDARIIGAALERSLVRPYLAARFPGRPVAVEFRLGRAEDPTSAEVFDLGAKARAAGYRIAMEELAEKTGYTLSEEPQAAAAGGMFPQDLRNGIANPLQNARRAPDGEMHPGDARGPSEAKSGETALLEAMASDLAPVRGRLEALLALPDAERPAAARALMEELPSLLPADPEMAAVLEEEMAKAFAEEVESGAEAVENAEKRTDGISDETARGIWKDVMGDEVDNA